MANGVTAIPGSSGLLGVFNAANGGRYMGITIRETAGAAAVVRLRQATSGGTIIEDISLVANESVRDYYGPQGVYVNGDIYYEKVSGTVEGSVRTA